VDIGFHLITPAAGDFDQFHPAPVASAGEFVQAFKDTAFGGGAVKREQGVKLDDAQRLRGGKQRGFDNAVDLGLVHAKYGLG